MHAHTWTQKDVCFILSLFSHLAVSPPCVNASALFGPVGHDRQVSTYSAPLVDIARPDRGPGGEASSKGCRGIFTLCEHYRSFCASSTSRNSSHAAGCLLRGFFMSCLSSKTRLTTEEDVDVTQTCDG